MTMIQNVETLKRRKIKVKYLLPNKLFKEIIGICVSDRRYTIKVLQKKDANTYMSYVLFKSCCKEINIIQQYRNKVFNIKNVTRLLNK